MAYYLSCYTHVKVNHTISAFDMPLLKDVVTNLGDQMQPYSVK